MIQYVMQVKIDFRLGDLLAKPIHDGKVTLPSSILNATKLGGVPVTKAVPPILAA